MNPSTLSRVRQLLPAYLNKTLDADDQAFMETWMREQSRLHPELLEEMRWLELSRAQIRELPPVVDPQAGWHELLSRIDAQPRAQRSRLAASPTWLDKLRLWWRMPVAAYAVLALLLVQSLTLTWLAWPDDTRLMSSTPPSVDAQQVIVQVVFKDTATVAMLRQAITGVDGAVVDGPGALGLWRISVPQAQAQQALATLQNDPAVDHAVLAPVDRAVPAP